MHKHCILNGRRYIIPPLYGGILKQGLKMKTDRNKVFQQKQSEKAKNKSFESSQFEQNLTLGHLGSHDVSLRAPYDAVQKHSNPEPSNSKNTSTQTENECSNIHLMHLLLENLTHADVISHNNMSGTKGLNLLSQYGIFGTTTTAFSRDHLALNEAACSREGSISAAEIMPTNTGNASLLLLVVTLAYLLTRSDRLKQALPELDDNATPSNDSHRYSLS